MVTLHVTHLHESNFEKCFWPFHHPVLHLLHVRFVVPSSSSSRATEPPIVVQHNKSKVLLLEPPSIHNESAMHLLALPLCGLECIFFYPLDSRYVATHPEEVLRMRVACCVFVFLLLLILPLPVLPVLGCHNRITNGMAMGNRAMCDLSG